MAAAATLLHADGEVPSPAPDAASEDAGADDGSETGVPAAQLEDAESSGLELGQLVSWRGKDDDVPRGTVGVLVAFRESFLSVRFGDERFAFPWRDVLDARPRSPLRVGDSVRWLHSDSDVPQGSVGTVAGFKPDSEAVMVEFNDHLFGFAPEQLEVAERGPEYPNAGRPVDGRMARHRPPCYPFEGGDVIEFEGRSVRVVVSPSVDEESGEPFDPLGVVVFCPGTHGGVGPCRTPGTNHCRNALFPTLAESLQAQGVVSCRVCWSAMNPPLDEAVQGATRAALLGLQRASELASSWHSTRKRRGKAPKLGVCLVGHSLGGAVVLNTARLLMKLLPEMTADGRGFHRGQELVGVCTLAAQESGSVDAVRGLDGDIRKLFLHGSADAILPYSTVERIYAAAPEPKDYCVLPDGEHDFYAFRAHLLARVESFILHALQRRSPSEQRGRRHRERGWRSSEWRQIWRAKLPLHGEG